MLWGTDFGKRSQAADGLPYWVTLVDAGFASSDNVRAWCSATYPTLISQLLADTCVPRRLTPPPTEPMSADTDDTGPRQQPSATAAASPGAAGVTRADVTGWKTVPRSRLKTVLIVVLSIVVVAAGLDVLR